MIAARKICEFVEKRLEPRGIFAIEELACGSAGRAEKGAADLIGVDLYRIEGHTTQALLPDQLLEGGKLKAVGLDAGQTDPLREDLLYDVLFCVRPLPAATEDVEDVDVRLFVQAAGGDDCEIGAGFGARGQIDEGAGLQG